MNDSFKKALIDYFQGWDLVDFLEVSSEDVVEAFEDLIVENEQELKEYIGYEEIDDHRDELDGQEAGE